MCFSKSLTSNSIGASQTWNPVIYATQPSKIRRCTSGGYKSSLVTVSLDRRRRWRGRWPAKHRRSFNSLFKCVCTACGSGIQCICNVGRGTKATQAKCSHGSCVGWALGDSWLLVAQPSSHASLPLVVRLTNCTQRQFCLLALPAEMKQKGKATQPILNAANKSG